MKKIGELIARMMGYYAHDTKRINHFMKVYAYAKAIGELEGLPERQQEILEAAAVVHDIGIHASEEKYGSSAGNYQQLEGPPLAEQMLRQLGYDEELVERVCYLVGHHHTYGAIVGEDYQILVEADFLVNLHEDNVSQEGIRSAREKIFRTRAGMEMLDQLF